jgi:hypothetical protein
MPDRRGTSPSKQPARVKRLVDLFGAENDIAPFDDMAPFDDAAFGKKVGELIARGASRKARKKQHGLRWGELVSLRKRER